MKDDPQISALLRLLTHTCDYDLPLSIDDVNEVLESGNQGYFSHAMSCAAIGVCSAMKEAKNALPPMASPKGVLIHLEIPFGFSLDIMESAMQELEDITMTADVVMLGTTTNHNLSSGTVRASLLVTENK